MKQGKRIIQKIKCALALVLAFLMMAQTVVKENFAVTVKAEAGETAKNGNHEVTIFYG